MFEFFLPYLIGTALGIEPSQTSMAAVNTDVSAVSLALDVVSEPAVPIMDIGFTSAQEVRPMLEMTKNNWVAVRSDSGQDILYFTTLLTWRCGLTSISYGVNGAPPSQPLEMEPCYAGTSAPNAMAVSDGFSPYVTFKADSLETITVAVAFDDGSGEALTFKRSDVMLR